MPSKFTSTASMSGMSAAIGCVEGSWSCLQAQAFQAVVNVVHELSQRVALAWASVPAQVANDSFSHRSSHQRMVTRSPNHMWAISCRIVSARRSRRGAGALLRETEVSREGGADGAFHRPG